LRTVVRQTLRYAAVFALAFGLSWVVLREELAAPVAYNEIMVPYGSKTVVVLSDSSKVWLNAGARFKYPTRFDGDRREVFLQGEGFFDVAKDAVRPFFVSAGGLNIKVLGTKLNVMANADDSRIEATLVEGSIEVLGMQAFGQGKPLTLQPGQTITLQKEADAYHVSKITGDEALPIPEEAAEEVKIRSASLSEKRDVNRTVAWKENKLIFADERFADAKVRLERWYGVVIEVEDPEILEYRFTGTFEKQTVEQAMAAFGKAALCHFRIENSRVVVSKLIIND
jgi:ferric-dicitrate binding protein FerR (iron transport regulator)